jgi:hypothetical protein
MYVYACRLPSVADSDEADDGGAGVVAVVAQRVAECGGSAVGAEDLGGKGVIVLDPCIVALDGEEDNRCAWWQGGFEMRAPGAGRC